MPPRPMNQAAIDRLVAERVNAAVEAERERQANARRQGNNGAGGQGGAPAARECTFSGFMKCNPTVFHGHEGAVELIRWFEKTEMVFGISECAEARKVKFAAATLQGRALTWWNSQVATREGKGDSICLSTTEKIVQIKNRLLTARSRQKSYADVRRKPMEFQVGDMVLLKVSPWKGVIRFGKRADENLVIPLEEIQLDDKMHFIEEPVEIMDREVKQLKQSRIPIVKVRWNSRRGPEYTWERKDFFKRNYPHLFSSDKKTRLRNRAPGRCFLQEGRM
ncbi:hypothetical protein Tco_1461440 [Tanacetum coccineum]